MRRLALLAAATLPYPALCQSSTTPQPVVPPVTAAVTVTATPEPLIANAPARSTVSLDPQAHPLLLTDPASYLRTDSSLDLQARGPAGVQTDISIRGSSFEQTLVLLNGLRLDDPQTSHFNFDLPLPLFALQSISVLHGAGSTLFGSDALGGAVDLRTLNPDQPTTIPTPATLRLAAAGGNFGANQQRLLASLAHGPVSEVLAGERLVSSGFLPDRDYRSEDGSSETRLRSPLGLSDVLLAGSDRPFGAGNFYGAYPSFEHTKSWFASLTHTFAPLETPHSTDIAVAFRRHTDDFILVRANPALYENHHISTSWQAVLRHRDDLGPSTRRLALFSGLDTNLEEIHSSSLGIHGRNRSAGYLSATLTTPRLTLSAGLREELLAGYGWVSAPGTGLSFLAAPRLRLRASAGYGFRLPTYTDLLYTDPTTTANPSLRPESAWSYDGGLDLFLSPRLTVSATGFASRQANAIDFVRPAPFTGPYQARNLSAVDLEGAELSLHATLPHRQQLALSYTGLTGVQSALAGLQSRYLFNLASNNASAEYLVTFPQLTARLRVGATQRTAQTAYSTLDLSLARESGRLRPFLQLTNLTNTGYSEITGVRAPARTALAGLELLLSHPAH